MFGQGFNYGFLGKPLCFTDTTDIFKDNSGVALYTLDYDASDSGNATGKFGEGAVFNGSSSRIDISNVLSGFTNTYSFSIWAKIDNTNNFPFFASDPTSLAASNIMRFALHQNGNYYFDFGNNSTARMTGTTPSGWRDNNWHHFVFVSTPTQKLAYVDGSLFNTLSSTTAISGKSTLTVGHYLTNYGGGLYDQLRIFDKSLSSSEVTTLYNETKNTTNTLQILGDTSCIATYKFDGNSSDLSGNYNGTDTNILYKYDGTPTAVDFGVGGKTLYGARFNGSSSEIDLPVGLGASGDRARSFWINVSAFPASGGQSIYYIGQQGVNDDYETLNVRSDGTIRYQERHDSGGAGDLLIESQTTISLNQWYNIIIVFDGLNRSMYINGSTALGNTGTKSTQTVNNSAYAGNLGSFRGVAGTATYDGSIDQFRVFNKALSSAEVSKLYGNGAGEIACEYTSTTDNVAYPIANTAYYKLDNNSKDSARSTGKFNEGAIFNGSSSVITKSNFASLSQLGLSMWVKISDVNSNYTLAARYGATREFAIYNYQASNGFVAAIYYNGNNNNAVIITAGDYLTNDTWHHIVFTSDGSTQPKLYIDGVQRGTAQSNNNTYYSTNEDLQIGGGVGRWLNGSIDQVRIYNTALSSTDVSNLYAETVSDTSTLSFPSGKTAIATYQLDGNSTDLSGNYNGTDTNITYAYDGTESNIEYKFGRFGQAALFNGTNSYIYASNSVQQPTTNFSASVWVLFHQIKSSSVGVIGNFKTGVTPQVGWAISHQNGTPLQFWADGTANSNGGMVQSTSSIPTNEWIHVVGTYDGSNVKIYINGSLENTKSYTQTPATTDQPLVIGRWYGNFNDLYTDGQIDQVRIFSSALTSSQVTELYNEKPEVDTSNFKAVLYEGNGSTQYISNVGFQPDLVWIKSRDKGTTPYTGSHYWFDSIRGALQRIKSDGTDGENTFSNSLTSFDTNGFSLGSGSNVNYNGDDFVAWVWKGGGLLNKSASFNGSSSKINTGIASISAPFAVSMWINESVLVSGHFFSNWNSTAADMYWETTSDGRLRISIDGTSEQYFGTAGDVQINTWHHIAVTLSNGVYEVYLDGVSLGTATTSVTTFSSGQNFMIGNSSKPTTPLPFNGKIDQVRIFNKGISSSEVTSLYNETASTINTLQVLGDTSCIAAYPLGTGAGDIGNTYSGTPTNVTFNNPGHLTRNTSGTIESTVSANTEAGFSIVKYQANSTQGATIGHGLSSPPEMIITKEFTGQRVWCVYHKDLTSSGYYLELNTTNSELNSLGTAYAGVPNSSTYSVGNSSVTNEPSTDSYIAYCWHSVAGYSKIGSYTGGGATNVPVSLGFQPRFVIIKRATGGNGSWMMYDNVRQAGTIPYDNYTILLADSSYQEQSDNTIRGIQFTSDGFILNKDYVLTNNSGSTYIYMAFK